jgi:O-antigen/teichoic acid export membrane protein
MTLGSLGATNVRTHDLTRPTLAVLASSTVALVSTLALRVMLARALTPGELGVLFAGIALVSWMGGIASLGLNAAVARRAATLLAEGDRDGAHVAARTALKLAAVVGSVAAGAVAVAAWLLPTGWLPRLNAHTLVALAPVVLGLPFGLVAVGVSRAFGDVKARALVRDAGGGALRLLAAGAAALARAPLVAVAGAFAAASLVGEILTVGYGVLRGWFHPAHRGSHDRALIAGLRPFALLECLNQTVQWTDMMLLGVLAPAYETGLFAVARGLSRALQSVVFAVAHSFLPAATDAWATRGADGLRSVYVRARALTFALLWPGLALCLVTPALPVRVLFGTTYAASAPALRLLAAALLLDALFGAKELALMAAGGASDAARAGTAGIVVGVAALLLLGPRLGATGAALAVLAMTTTKASVSTWALQRRAGVRVFEHDLPASVRGALGLVVVVLLAGALAAAPELVMAAAVVSASAAGSVAVVIAARRRESAKTGPLAQA